MQPTFTEKIVFVQKWFGKGQISRTGADIAVCCPYCNESKKKKLSISLTTWQFHCWVCAAKGKTLLPILRKFKSREAVAEFRSRFLGEVLQFEEQQKVEELKFEYPEGYVPLGLLLDTKNPNTKACIRYLQKRGWSDSDIFKYRAGVTPGGKDPRRVYFISLDADGEENYFVSRSIDDTARMRYINSQLDKTQIVFNECDIDWDQPVYLVEGIFDLVQMKRNTVCLLGSSLPESSLLFKKLVANECDVILALDSDVQMKAAKIADNLCKYGCAVKMFPLDGAKDVGSMTQEQLDDADSRLIKWTLATSLISKIGNIRSGSLF